MSRLTGIVVRKMTIERPVPGVEVDFEPDIEDITIESEPDDRIRCERARQLDALRRRTEADSEWCMVCAHASFSGGSVTCLAVNYMRCPAVMTHLLGDQAE